MEKELKIIPPEGYEIDKENSTSECIKFKRITERWRDNGHNIIEGYYILSATSSIKPITNQPNNSNNYNIFATEKQAKSALAMARISQIIDNDKRFGGPITDEEWIKDDIKYVIERTDNVIGPCICKNLYRFLAFHTGDQRELFLEENEDLIKDYLMID